MAQVLVILDLNVQSYQGMEEAQRFIPKRLLSHHPPLLQHTVWLLVRGQGLADPGQRVFLEAALELGVAMAQVAG